MVVSIPSVGVDEPLPEDLVPVFVQRLDNRIVSPLRIDLQFLESILEFAITGVQIPEQGGVVERLFVERLADVPSELDQHLLLLLSVGNLVVDEPPIFALIRGGYLLGYV